MKRRMGSSSYKTHYTSRRRRSGGGGGAKWLAVLAVAGLIVYVALAMGLGNVIHDRFLAPEEPGEDELTDATPQPTQALSSEITETVAFPRIEVYALSAGSYPSRAEAQKNALLFAARGGAGYVEEGDEYQVLLSAYNSRKACETVAEKLGDEENIAAQVVALAADAVELKLTAQAQRIDGIRDAFAIWQQTTQMLSDLWQDVDSGVCSAQQAKKRVSDQREKLKETMDTAFSDALIQGQATALDGLYGVLQATLQGLDAIAVEEAENVLEVSSKIKYTEISSLTEYQSYVEALKAQMQEE